MTEHQQTVSEIKFKSLTLNVPESLDVAAFDGLTVRPECARMIVAMLETFIQLEQQRESNRVPADSPLACAQCGKYRAFRCSLCPDQVCSWCHRPGVDHHGDKPKGFHTPSNPYIMTDLETGAVIPHRDCREEGENSMFIAEPLSGPCQTCGYEGYKFRLLYRKEEDGRWWEKGVAFSGICDACGAGNGNFEPV